MLVVDTAKNLFLFIRCEKEMISDESSRYTVNAGQHSRQSFLISLCDSFSVPESLPCLEIALKYDRSSDVHEIRGTRYLSSSKFDEEIN